MTDAVDLGSYKELILYLVTAGVIVPLFAKLKISPVLGFIGAGALLGPFGLGRLADTVPWLRPLTIGQAEEVSHIAEFGVVFLMFTIGIELSLERLRTLRRLVFGLGASQVALTVVTIAGLGVALGLPTNQALIGAVALSLSSTAIVIPILSGQRRLNAPSGRASFSVLLFQDLAVAPVLFTIQALSAAESGNIATGLLVGLAQAAVALAGIVLVGRVALRPLFGLVAQSRSSELFMAACLLVIVATALVAARFGLSMALGAFVAGLLLAETEYRRAIEAMVEPFKGLLLGVFFVSVGMGLDLAALGRAPVTILVAAALLVALKAAIVTGLGRLFRLPLRVGLETGLLLGPGGEFAFVIIGGATAANLIPGDVAQAALVITTVSMIAIPVLAKLARRLGRKLASAGPAAAPPVSPSEDGRVIVVGFGRVGQLVGEMLGRHGVPYVGIDANAALVTVQRASGRPVYFGDSRSPLLLEACGLPTAKALVITLDDPAAIETVFEISRRTRPDLTVVARARDDRHARTLYRLGVNDAVPETIEASLQLSEAVLVDVGIAMGPVIASIHERREEFRRALRSPGEAAAPVREAEEFRGRRTIRKPG